MNDEESSPAAQGAGGSNATFNIVESHIGKIVMGSNTETESSANKKSHITDCAEDCYPEGEQPKILIISNDEWEKDPLPGYKIDTQKLEEMWDKDFGCDVTVHENDPCKRILKHIDNFKKLLTGKEKFCAVFILSHGGHHKEDGEVVYCKEYDSIPVDSILELFDNSNEKLQNKPKLFVFQFCRGENAPKGVPAKIKNGATAAGARDERLPQMSDALIMYATQPKDVAIVDEDGSWLIKDLMTIFKEHAHRKHVADMLTMVNRKVSKRIVTAAKDKTLKGVKCMSEIRSTFLYNLHIKPQQ